MKGYRCRCCPCYRRIEATKARLKSFESVKNTSNDSSYERKGRVHVQSSTN